CKSSEPGIRGDNAGEAGEVPSRREPAALVGRWKADGSGRELEAREKNGVVTFHVLDPAAWKGAYAAGEVRFSIRSEGTGFLVTDRYRPFDLDPGVHYQGDEGRASCVREHTTDAEGKPLHAELTDPTTLSVDFAQVQQSVVPDSVTLEVLSCRDPKVIGVLRRTLRRVQPP
ncbi:MAG: hypothetical protein ACXWUG_28010, partial [Polyangiales bacterium]